MEPRPAVYTVRETAAILKTSEDTIYRMCDRGQLPVVPCGDPGRPQIRISASGLWEMVRVARPVRQDGAPYDLWPEGTATDAAPRGRRGR
jgi:excisionase family DNA binding protein